MQELVGDDQAYHGLEMNRCLHMGSGWMWLNVRIRVFAAPKLPVGNCAADS